MSLLENVSRVYWKITGSATTNLSGSGCPEDPFMLPSAGARQTALRNAARALYDQTATNGGLTAAGTNYDIPATVTPPAVTLKPVVTDETLYCSGLAASIDYQDTAVTSGATIMYSQRPDQQISGDNEFRDHPGRMLTAAGVTQAQTYWNAAVTWLTAKGHINNANNQIILDFESWAPTWEEGSVYTPTTEQASFIQWAATTFPWFQKLDYPGQVKAAKKMYNRASFEFFKLGMDTIRATFPLCPIGFYGWPQGTPISASTAASYRTTLLDIYKKQGDSLYRMIDFTCCPLYPLREVVASGAGAGQANRADWDAFLAQTQGLSGDVATYFGIDEHYIVWTRYSNLASDPMEFANAITMQTIRDTIETSGASIVFEWEDWSTTSQTARGLSGAAMKAEYEQNWFDLQEPIYNRQVAE